MSTPKFTSLIKNKLSRESLYRIFSKLLLDVSLQFDIPPAQILQTRNRRSDKLIIAKERLVSLLLKRVRVNTKYGHIEDKDALTIRQFQYPVEITSREWRKLSTNELAILMGYKSHASIVRLLKTLGQTTKNC